MKQLKCRWQGTHPLLLHNGALADSLNPTTIQIKEITAKGKKKTDTDNERLSDLEWEGSFYWNDEIGVFIPNDNIERCIQLGAMKSKLGKDIAMAVFVQDSIVPLHFKDEGKSIDALRKKPEYRFTKGVVIKKNRIMRTRPIIQTPWYINFVLEYDDTIISEKNLKKCILDSGSMIGLGDWRPKYGRFIATFGE